MAEALPRAVPDSHRSMIYEFAMDSRQICVSPTTRPKRAKEDDSFL
jgi:guanylate kinase